MKIVGKLSLFKKADRVDSNPAYDFFVKKSSREKKKAYLKALKEAEKDQRAILYGKEKTS